MLGLPGSSRYRSGTGRFLKPALLLKPALFFTQFFAAAFLGYELSHDPFQRLRIVSTLSEFHFEVRPAAAGLPDKIFPVSPSLG